MYKFDKTKLAAKNINKVDLSGKKVLIRTCLNVALAKDGSVADGTRIDEALPGLRDLGARAERVVIMAHLGRPTTARESEFSLEVVRKVLEARLGESVVMLADEDSLEALANGKIAESKFYLIENIRYFAGEEDKDGAKRREFAGKLAKLADVFVNDAFADYRASASTYEIAELLPCYVGPLFAREVEAVGYFAAPRRPFVAVLGGAKLSEKLDALLALCGEADKILIGGAMAYTLMLAEGKQIGKSLAETDKIDVAKQILQKYREKIVLPLDHIIVDQFDPASPAQATEGADVPDGKIAVDIGPKTRAAFAAELGKAEAILWNGPMGVFEWDSAAAGTKQIGEAIVAASAYKFAGGGDSIAAINKFGLAGFDHVSTGGGAMLAFISYDEFPTLDVLLK